MSDNSSERTVLLATFSSEVEATMAHDKLADAGIPCMLNNELFSGIYPMTFSSLGAIRLMVFERDKERALHLLEAEE